MFIMQFNEKFICIVSKSRHICYIFAIFSHTFYLFILFICLYLTVIQFTFRQRKYKAFFLFFISCFIFIIVCRRYSKHWYAGISHHLYFFSSVVIIIESHIPTLEIEELLTFSDKFTDELSKIKLPHTKFQLLVKSLKKAIREYGRTNQLKAQRFDERLQKVVDQYNARDKLVFANEVASQTVNSIQEVVRKRLSDLTEEVLSLFRQLRKAREEFKRLGITFEEKAFYDILVDQREAHGFEYPDERCLTLARKIKELIDNSAVYADWLNNDNLKADLQAELTILLYQEGYPPEWDEEVFNRVMEQVRNFKTYNN